MPLIRVCSSRYDIINSAFSALTLLFSLSAHSFSIMTAGSYDPGLSPLPWPTKNKLETFLSPAQLLSHVATTRKLQNSFSSIDTPPDEEGLKKRNQHNLKEFLKKYIIVINEYGHKAVIDRADISQEHLKGDASRTGSVTHTDIDTYVMIDSSSLPKGILFIPVGKGGDKGNEEKTASPPANEDQFTNPTNVPTQKKRPLKALGLGTIKVPSYKRRRLSTNRLSFDSTIVRHYIAGGARLVKGHMTGALSLLAEHINDCQVIESKGHRLVVSLQLIHKEKNQETSQWVLKLSDDGYKDQFQAYHEDITLVTFKQAMKDIHAFLKIKDAFLLKFPDSAQRVIFPSTRLVIVSFQDFTRMLTRYFESQKDNPNYDKPDLELPFSMLNEMMRISPSKHSGYIFLVMQEFIQLRPMEASDMTAYRMEINFLSTEILDVDQQGNNIMFEKSSNKLVILDVERNQLSWKHFTTNYEEMAQPTLASMPESVVAEWPSLTYIQIPQPTHRSIHRSISVDTEHPSDSDFISDFDSPTPGAEPQIRLLHEISIDEGVFEEESVFPEEQ